MTDLTDHEYQAIDDAYGSSGVAGAKLLLRLRATLDTCPPAASTTPDSPAQPDAHSQPGSAASAYPARSAASPSTTPHHAATPTHSPPTKSSAATPAATPSTPPTSNPPTGAATPEAAPTSPTASEQPDDNPTSPHSSMTTGDLTPGQVAVQWLEFGGQHPGFGPLTDWQRSHLRALLDHLTPARDRLDLDRIAQQLEDGPTEAVSDRVKLSPPIIVSDETLNDWRDLRDTIHRGEGGSDV